MYIVTKTAQQTKGRQAKTCYCKDDPIAPKGERRLISAIDSLHTAPNVTFKRFPAASTLFMHCTSSTKTAAAPGCFLSHWAHWAGRVAHAPRGACVITRASLYDLLGVASSASTAEIRTAFRRLAARYHPDLNSSFLAHEKFQVSSTSTKSVCASITTLVGCMVPATSCVCRNRP